MNTSESPRYERRPSTVELADMPDEDYVYRGILAESSAGETIIRRVCVGLFAIAGIACYILAAKFYLEEHPMIHFANALITTAIAVPACIVAAYLLFNGARGRIE